MKIIESFTKNNRCYKNATVTTKKGIMIHSVGCPQPNASVFIKQFDTTEKGEAVHAFLEPNGNAYQTLPFEYKAWHCGGSGNTTHIGIEMVEPSTIQYIGGASFKDNNPKETAEFVKKTYKTAVDLFAKLCIDYNFNPLESGVILSHSEGTKAGIASNHADVEHIWSKYGLTMNDFRDDIAEKIIQLKGDDEMVTKTDIIIDGKKVNVDRILKDGKNYVELRAFEKAGYKVGYDANTKTPTFNK